MLRELGKDGCLYPGSSDPVARFEKVVLSTDGQLWHGTMPIGTVNQDSISVFDVEHRLVQERVVNDYHGGNLWLSISAVISAEREIVYQSVSRKGFTETGIVEELTFCKGFSEYRIRSNEQRTMFESPVGIAVALAVSAGAYQFEEEGARWAFFIREDVPRANWSKLISILWHHVDR